MITGSPLVNTLKPQTPRSKILKVQLLVLVPGGQLRLSGLNIDLTEVGVRHHFDNNAFLFSTPGPPRKRIVARTSSGDCPELQSKS